MGLQHGDLGHALLNDVGQFLDEMRQAYDDDGNGVSCGMRSLDKVMRGGCAPASLRCSWERQAKANHRPSRM